MSKFKLAFGIHNHQPVGNFDFVFEQAHSRAYLPFLKMVSKHKHFRMSLHQSGILWDWQKKNHPEYFELVRKMVESGQIELMTGGFYEPILPSISDRDAVGQIQLLTKYVKKNFSRHTNGLWLTERVWEPQLPEILARSGVKYVPVDDAHFIYAGFELSQLNEPYVTESNGHIVTLLPIQKRLRYLIPFGTIQELFAELR
ncbi:MAG: 4-alpha-glucanotransferase, partial [Candidatus Zixiibacteriota bacterium]